ncbi:uncharacterized protein LOC144303181 isoform X2 [Canis aureus]
MASWCCWETAPVVDFPFFTCHHCPEATASTLARGEKSYEYLLCEVLSRCRAFLPMKSLQLQEVKTKRIQYIRERPKSGEADQKEAASGRAQCLKKWERHATKVRYITIFCTYKRYMALQHNTWR